MVKFINYWRLIASCGIFIFLISLIIKVDNLVMRIIFIPFTLCALIFVFQSLFIILEKKKYVDLMTKFYNLSFLAYWFIIVGFSSYYSLVNKKYDMFIFTIPFWIAGFFILYKTFKK